MVLIMLGTSGVAFWVLIGVLGATSSEGGQAPVARGGRRTTLAVAFPLLAAATIVAGVVVLLFG